MATYNTVIKKRNETNTGWDSVLPITTADNVLMDSSGNTVATKMQELFQNVSDGKNLIAAAISDKKVESSGDKTFGELSQDIKNINISRYELKKLSTYELMTLYGFDPVKALQLTK